MKNKLTLEEYSKLTGRTLSDCGSPIMNDLHMVLGMQTEVSEIADVYKKHIAYGKNLDLVNVKEELGDAMWYIQNMCNMNNWSLEEILYTNIEKLKSRYPEKFTNDNALNRDLDKEREILEN